MGHGKSALPWNSVILLSRPGKPWILIVGHGKSSEMMFMKRNITSKKAFF